MENNIVQLVRPPRKHNEQYVQIFVIDGCNVRVNFRPEKIQDNQKSTLDNIRKILLTSDLVK